MPCGPFKTSTLSKSIKPKSLITLSLTLWPLTAATMELVTAAPIPKEPIPLTIKADPEPIDLETSKPGTTSAKSDKSYICSAARLSASKA